MKVIITGTTGYVGEGVLLSCLDNPEITEVLSVSRRSTGRTHPKLKELLIKDFMTLSNGDEHLQGYDAVFYCMGVSSVGMNEKDYSVPCHDIPVHFAGVIEQRENTTFIYVTGGGAELDPDSKTMWARVKGKTEMEIKAMGFKDYYGFRVMVMKPYEGQAASPKIIRMSQIMYPIMRIFGQTNTMDEVAKAMIACAKGNCDHYAVTVKDVTNLARK
ncbi:NAD-dependent epimerase/dehydratase family protein [Phocaeicola oris]|uniref:NAD-dependent epimerase/dehydratase family protein n=1 Tax=Phocaeicola oris TaxID=2896850 RepID=UPI00234F9BB7|nr:NAD-dependent epimerase/dehydratase family protein [Phocaeicola oris]MCE2615328.1 NAD-dependent epimerase/dehydratase family protein [Phocaeicola oris]